MKISGTAPARRSAPATGFSLLNRYSLKSLLMGSVGMVVLFCVLVIIYVRVSQGITFSMMDSLINVDNAIADLCLKSNAAMTDARRLEKDFLLNYKEFGFDESRSRYITRLITGIAEIKENLARIRNLGSDRETARQTTEVGHALERYRRGVEALADKFGERGFLDTGIHGSMRSEALEIEKLVRENGSDRLLVGLLVVRRAEKNFVEREQDADVASLEAALEEFTAAAAAARLPAEARASIQARAARYLGLFLRYVQATEEIRTIKREYLRAVQAVDPLLEQLYVGSLNRVAEKQRAIERSTRRLSLPVIVAGGLALALTGLFSLAVAHTVTRSVVESQTFAEQIASGDLDSRLAPVGRNEFSSLAIALNAMAEALHEADIARKNSIDALRESEEKYRSFVETSTDWIWEIDLEGKHAFSNERVREILGIEPAQLLNSSSLELLHPDDVPRIGELLGASRSSGRGWQGAVLRWRHKDGTYRWLESNAVPVTDARGKLVGFRGVDRDVTERRRLENELIKTQKLEAIGTLAGGIAHDFNNLLQGLFGYISLARVNLEHGGKAAELLEQAEKALNLSVNLTTQLLTFAKGGKPVKRLIAVPAVLEDPVKFALSGSRSDYRIVVDKDLWSVDADEGQLGQVIQNLVLNASEAMPQGGTVEVAAQNEVIAEGGNPLVPAGGHFVRIDVRDSGAGIVGQHLTRIFDPYFTTKQKGSGLGLATSYSIVRGHNGFIDVTSRLGEGSVFSVYLPASLGGGIRAPETGANLGEGVGKILVMDDDEVVRDVAAGMLESLGHAVTTAASGEEAVNLYCRAREEGGPFDVVILDLTVKRGMGGEGTILKLRELDPGIKAVVSSGYSDAAVVADYRSYGFSACLNKPYRLGALRNCLLALLKPSSLETPAACPREGR